MPADEKPSASGRDHTPDDRPEDDSAPGSGPANTGDDAAGGDTTAPETGSDGADRAQVSDETEGAEEAGKAEEAPETGVTSDTDGTQEAQKAGEPAETEEAAETGDAQRPAGTEEASGVEEAAGGEKAVETEETPEEQAAGSAAGAEGDTGNTEAAEAGVTTETAEDVPAVRTKRRRTGRILVWVAASLVLVLAAGIGTAYGYYRSLRSDMVQYDIDGLLKEEDRPERINDSVNILFMGTDGYEEGSTAYSTEFEGERSDSVMLAHISPESRVSVISFPRDSLVALPECEPYGDTEGTSGYFGMINAAMYHGGPPCVVRTIESLSDVRIDHFVHLSFMSFRDVVDAIGGVDMCIPEPMEDSRSKLDLDAGQQTLDGDDALSFVRARYEIGDGGDIGRIDRQQMFLAALADQVTSNDVITDPGRLNAVLRAVAEHSATDSALTFDRMLSIAVTLADVELTDIEFHTVPWYQAPSNPNRVLWYEDQAEELFTAVREDRPLPLTMADEAPVPQDPPGASPSPADEDVADASPEDDPARPGVGRDATSSPCSDGLGYGTGDELE
ncbi:LCP family protein [Nocardiopsis akebiae]|uniref:LCP family protein n=1 Tax=Nocardiopsis akebiae TaxID=2831968 RepID=A0ABX8C5W7_9ACTN|nr:LCP family protein [Nocardiopsis akebiae]QUX29290.1 LCP family protein [Nocardiopsis akebiae]